MALTIKYLHIEASDIDGEALKTLIDAVFGLAETQEALPTPVSTPTPKKIKGKPRSKSVSSAI